MSADYRTDPLKVSCVALGGIRASVGLELFVDDDHANAANAVLHDVHDVGQGVAVDLKASKKTGDARLIAKFALIPDKGSGAYTITITLEHPSFGGVPAEIEYEGSIGKQPGSFKRTLRLP